MGAVNALVSHSHRWKAAKLSFTRGIDQAFDKIWSDSDFAQLHTLSLYGPGSPLFDAIQYAEIDAAALPELHSLEMFNFEMKDLEALGRQLVHLVAHPTFLKANEWALVLSSCNVLEYLEIGWGKSRRYEPDSPSTTALSTIAPSTIPISKLKTFIVRHPFPDAFIDIVGRVRSPHLTTFSVGMSSRYLFNDLQNIMGWKKSLREFVSRFPTNFSVDIYDIFDGIFFSLRLTAR
jgi:hypothetical protein